MPLVFPQGTPKGLSRLSAPCFWGAVLSPPAKSFTFSALNGKPNTKHQKAKKLRNRMAGSHQEKDCPQLGSPKLLDSPRLWLGCLGLRALCSSLRGCCPANGCGSKIGTQNGTLASGNMGQNLLSPGGSIWTHTQVAFPTVERKKRPNRVILFLFAGFGVLWLNNKKQGFP